MLVFPLNYLGCFFEINGFVFISGTIQSSITEISSETVFNPDSLNVGQFSESPDTLQKKPVPSETSPTYLNRFNNFTGKIRNNYKKIDSIFRSDTGTVEKFDVVYNEIKKSIQSKKRLNDSLENYKSNISSLPEQNGNPKFQMDLPLAEKRKAEGKVANNYLDSGEYYLKINKPGLAAINFEKAIEIGENNHSPLIIQNALKGLSEAYAQKSDSKKSLIYFKQYSNIKDSLSKIITEQAMADLQSKYEFEKKQREIQSLVSEGVKKESQLQKTQAYIQKQSKFIALIILTLFLTFLLAISLFMQYRSKKKSNDSLLLQNNTINKQKKELEESLIYTRQLQEALREDLDHYMQLALRKQMNPHFIFNSLNSIQSFILQNDKLSANIYLSKFSGLMRQVFENSRHELISLKKELEMLKLYVELEEQRFDKKFICRWEIEPEGDHGQHLVPPLVLQPYVENAIWHGLLHKNGERTLLINVKTRDGHLICSIEDNGIGRKAAAGMRTNKSSHESLGTKITEKRIQLLNSLNKSGIGVQYYDLKDDFGNAFGTKVELIIPCNEIYT